MARLLRIIYPGAFYHITSRGNQRKEIFKSQADREKFLSYLETATRRIRMNIEGGKKLKKQIKRVEKKLNLSKM
jgi:REP element-mobilizing transposase RayT